MPDITTSFAVNIHLFLAVVTLGILLVAFINALVLAYLNNRLKTNQSLTLLEKFPPLETMEKYLFRILSFGFVLLSILLLSSFIFFHDTIEHSDAILSKAIAGAISWFILAVILWGRYRFGWRDRKAIYATIIAIMLIMVIFFMS